MNLVYYLTIINRTEFMITLIPLKYDETSCRKRRLWRNEKSTFLAFSLSRKGVSHAICDVRGSVGVCACDLRGRCHWSVRYGAVTRVVGVGCILRLGLARYSIIICKMVMKAVILVLCSLPFLQAAPLNQTVMVGYYSESLCPDCLAFSTKHMNKAIEEVCIL